MDAEEYVVIDDNVTAREIPTDEEIGSIVKNCESNESEDGDSETEPVSYAQAITASYLFLNNNQMAILLLIILSSEV